VNSIISSVSLYAQLINYDINANYAVKKVCLVIPIIEIPELFASFFLRK